MTENLRGENNLFRNAVLNTVEVLKKFPSETGRKIKEIYEEDVLNPRTPSFAVIVTNLKDERRSSQNLTQIRYTANIGLEVWYYYSDLTEEIKRNEITYVLWEISELLRTNITLNGFCPKLGIEILNVRWVPRIKGSRVIAGGVIEFIAKPLITTTITS